MICIEFMSTDINIDVEQCNAVTNHAAAAALSDINSLNSAKHQHISSKYDIHIKE